MSQAFVIQIAGKTAGIVARDNDGENFHFFAASAAFHCLETMSFSEPQTAEREARRISRRPKQETTSGDRRQNHSEA